MEAGKARIVLAERESLDLLFSHGVFRGRRCDPPDVILIDVVSGDVPAHAMLRRLRGDARLRHVPVVFLCRSEAEGKRAMAASDRPDGFVVKPVRWPFELAAVRV
jgi:CheY-like chemotaxis protein